MSCIYSRLHTGGSGENAAKFTSTSVHVVVALPTSSKPVLQVYVAVSPTKLPVNVTMPLTMSAGSEHSAAEQE